MSPRIIRNIVIIEESFKNSSKVFWQEVEMIVPPLPDSQLPADILDFHCIKLDLETVKKLHPSQTVSQAIVFSVILILISIKLHGIKIILWLPLK